VILASRNDFPNKGFRLTSYFFFSGISLIFLTNFSTKLLFLAFVILNSLIQIKIYSIASSLRVMFLVTNINIKYFVFSPLERRVEPVDSLAKVRRMKQEASPYHLNLKVQVIGRDSSQLASPDSKSALLFRSLPAMLSESQHFFP